MCYYRSGYPRAKKLTSFNVSRGCGSCIIATSCIIASSECSTKDASSAGRVVMAGHMTSDQPDTDVDFKECNNHLLHTKCALSDLMHCFRSIWLVRCHVTSNKCSDRLYALPAPADHARGLHTFIEHHKIQALRFASRQKKNGRYLNSQASRRHFQVCRSVGNGRQARQNGEVRILARVLLQCFVLLSLLACLGCTERSVRLSTIVLFIEYYYY